jgi:hypothetical protein
MVFRLTGLDPFLDGNFKPLPAQFCGQAFSEVGFADAGVGAGDKNAGHFSALQ